MLEQASSYVISCASILDALRYLLFRTYLLVLLVIRATPTTFVPTIVAASDCVYAVSRSIWPLSTSAASPVSAVYRVRAITSLAKRLCLI